MIHPVLLAMLLGTVTPRPVQIPVAAHNAQCDQLTDRHDPRAADACLQAADEWSQIASERQGWHDPNLPHIELLGAACRVQASWGLARTGHESPAFDQMMLATSIAVSVGRPSKDPYVRAFAASIVRSAYRAYPHIFEDVAKPAKP